jgi:hypothetical protein
MDCLFHILVIDTRWFQGISILFILRESSQGWADRRHPSFRFQQYF